MKCIKKGVVFFLALIVAVTSLVTGGSADSRTRPTVILESYSLEGRVTAGGDIELTYVLRNTSPYSEANNILLTWGASGNAIYPAHGSSNQQYVERIAPSGMYTGVMTFTVQDTLEPDVYGLSLSLAYQGPENVSISSTAAIALVVQESGTLVINEVLLSSECIVGRQSFISVKYENPGSEDVRNAQIIIEGDIRESETRIHVGTVRAYASSVAEGYVTFQSTGEKTLEISMIFEDKNGGEFSTLIYTSGVTVLSDNMAEPQPTQPEGNGQETENRGSTWRDIPLELLLIAGAAMAVLIVVLIVVLVRRRKKR